MDTHPAGRLADHLGLRADQGTRVRRYGDLELRISPSASTADVDVHAGLGRWLDTYTSATFDGRTILLAGDGEHHRMKTLLEGEAAEYLTAMPPNTVSINDFGVHATLGSWIPLPAQAELVGRIVQLGTAIERAAARVPIATDVAAAVPALRRAATTHHLDLTPCPLGLLGTVDSCPVDLFRFRPERHRRLAFIHVSVPGVEPGGWMANARQRTLGTRTKGALAALLGLGRVPKTGAFAFDRRFRLEHGKRAALDRTAAELLARTADEYAVSIDAGKIIVGIPLLDPKLHHLTELIANLTAAARLMGEGVAAPDTRSKAAGPYR